MRGMRNLTKRGSIASDMAMYAIGSPTRLMPAVLAGAAMDTAIFSAIRRLVSRKEGSHMPTLGELMEKFGSAATDANEIAAPDDAVVSDANPAVGDGVTKTASGGDDMESLQDIYLSIAGQDSMYKEAAQAADVPTYYDDNDDNDFAKMAAAIASAEADEIVADDAVDENDIVKIASEYDAAGRIMARGFYDEFSKLAGATDTEVTPNTDAETPSQSQAPAYGEHGAVTVPTNFAGTKAHDKPIETTGPGPQAVYKDVLKTQKSMAAGQGTAAPQSPMGDVGAFATINDLKNGQPG